MKFYTCPMCCNSGFTNQQDLKEHLLKASNPINCPACFKSCKNVIYLIKHLDQCSASKQEDEQSSYSNRTQNPILDDDEDDVEGYFCTVCDIKIPDVYKHIQQFHTGQEVILQDDDDDEGETLNPAQFFNSDKTDNTDSNYDSKSNSLSNKRESKRKDKDECNGDEENHNSKKIKKKFKNDDTVGEALYCIKCDISFPSLTDHMKNYHNNYDVILQDVSITELFPESKTSNGSLAYNCSCCRKSFVRKTTLMKHLKLHVCKEKFKAKKNCCRKKSEDRMKKSDSSLSGSSNNSSTEYDNENESENASLLKTEPEEDEFDVTNSVKTENFELEGLNHIFDT